MLRKPGQAPAWSATDQARTQAVPTASKNRQGELKHQSRYQVLSSSRSLEPLFRSRSVRSARNPRNKDKNQQQTQSTHGFGSVSHWWEPSALTTISPLNIEVGQMLQGPQKVILMFSWLYNIIIVLIVVILHVCFFLSGHVNHSVCITNTIIRNRGGGKDFALCLHVDSYLHVSSFLLSLRKVKMFFLLSRMFHFHSGRFSFYFLTLCFQKPCGSIKLPHFKVIPLNCIAHPCCARFFASFSARTSARAHNITAFPSD